MRAVWVLGLTLAAGPVSAGAIEAVELDVYDLTGKSEIRRDVAADDPVAFWELRKDGAGLLRRAKPEVFGRGVALGELGCGGREFALEIVVVKGARGTLWQCEGSVGVAVGDDDELFLLEGRRRTPTGLRLALAYEVVGLSTHAAGGVTISPSGLTTWRSPRRVRRATRSKIVVGPGLRGVVDRVVVFDREVHPSLWMNRLWVSSGQVAPTANPADAPLSLEVRSVARGRVFNLAVSPDSRTLASVGADHVVRLWDLEQGQILRSLRGHTSSVRAVDWSRDGSRVLTGDDGGNIKVWDASRGTLLASASAGGRVQQARWLPDGFTLATATGPVVTRWLVSKTGVDEVARMVGPGSVFPIERMAVQPNGRTLATLDHQGLNCTWDLGAAKLTGCTPGGGGRGRVGPRDLAWAPSGLGLALAARTAVRVVAETGTVEREVGAQVTSLAWSSESALAVATLGGEVHIFRWDGLKKTRVIQLESRGAARQVAWQPGSSRLVTVLKRIEVWDAETGARVADLGEPQGYTEVGFSPDGRHLVVSNPGLRLYDTTDYTLAHDLQATLQRPILVWNSEEELQVSATHAFDLRGLELRERRLSRARASSPFTLKYDRASGRTDVRRGDEVVLQVPKAPRQSLTLSPDSAKLAVINFSSLTVHDLAKGTAVGPVDLSGLPGERKGGALGPSLRWSGASDEVRFLLGGALYTASTSTLKLERRTEPSESTLPILYSDDDGARLALRYRAGAGGGARVRFFQARPWRELRAVDEPYETLAPLVFRPGHEEVGVVYGDEVRVTALKTGAVRTTRHPGGAGALAWSPSGARLALTSGQSVRVATDDGWVELLVDKAGDWAARTHDGYFAASPRGDRLLSASRGMSALSLDQIAPIANRPDIVAARLGAPAEAVRFYEALYQRRVSRLGLRPGAAVGEVIAPVARVVSASPPSAAGRVKLELSLRAPRALETAHVFVNGVPTSAPRVARGRRARVAHEVQLSPGRNEVEVEALAGGVRSSRARHVVDWPSARTPTLYFLGFGVSDYARDDLDLAYAHQDVADLRALFKKLGPRAKVQTFTDAEVNRASLRAARAFLQPATEADVAVLFVAGHGMRDDDALRTYYYLGHDADPDRLQDTAIPFEDIEALLYETRARQRLFLLDTCESGEDLELARAAAPSAPHLRMRAARGFKRVNDGRGIQRVSAGRGVRRAPGLDAMILRALRERDRYIVQDLARASGAVVLASSLGTEASLEAEKWRNGAFTEELLHALSTRVADVDGDGALSVDELKAWVLRAVPALTGDAQHPNVRSDNPRQRFVLPLPKR